VGATAQLHSVAYWLNNRPRAAPGKCRGRTVSFCYILHQAPFACFCTGERKELLVDAYGVVSLVSLSLQSKMDLVFLITSWCFFFFFAAVSESHTEVILMDWGDWEVSVFPTACIE
jgi:hypothetical protein